MPIFSGSIHSAAFPMREWTAKTLNHPDAIAQDWIMLYAIWQCEILPLWGRIKHFNKTASVNTAADDDGEIPWFAVHLSSPFSASLIPDSVAEKTEPLMVGICVAPVSIICPRKQSSWARWYAEDPGERTI